MASPGNQGAAKAQHLRVLLPFTSDTLVNATDAAAAARAEARATFTDRLPFPQRIPDEVAAEIGADEALIVAPAGGKVIWPVEVGQDGDGAFLGRGWPEFAEACGVGAGWLLVLRHRGRGVLSAKAFDDTFCLRELGGAPAPPAGAQDSPCESWTTSSQFLIGIQSHRN